MSVFQNKVAVITGAGSGIGKALAEEMARRGAIVCICDVKADRIEKVAEGIRQAGGKATGSVVDVANYDAVKKLIEDAAKAHGQIDYVFNNAGIAVGGAAINVTIDDWRKVIDVDLMGVVYGATVAYAMMAKQGFGHIVNTASVEGLVPFPATSSYATCKFGVVGLSGALRIEGADLGVKVSVVCPGYIKTPIFTDSKFVGMDVEKVTATLPGWVGITPEECANRILCGVEHNRPYIVVTLFAKILWWINRISPSLAIVLMRAYFRDARKKGIIS